MVQVRALMKCFVGNCLRDVGEVFEFTGELDPTSTVLVAVEPEPEPEPEPKKEPPKKRGRPRKASPGDRGERES